MTSVLPRGLESRNGERFDEAAMGGGDLEWLPFEKVKLYTNAFIRQENKLLLGYKKRGFGKGLYNGFGGKIDPGETAAEAAVRELQEEAGIRAPLDHHATLFFMSADSKEAAHIEIYYSEEYSGIISESEEMRPQWFAINRASEAPAAATQPEGNVSSLEVSDRYGLLPIPFNEMWEDDAVWMPFLLAGRHFVGRVDFGPEGQLQKWWFGLRPIESR